MREGRRELSVSATFTEDGEHVEDIVLGAFRAFLELELEGGAPRQTTWP